MNIERYNLNGRFHEAVIYNGMIFISGQVASHTDGSCAEQAVEILGNLAKTLERCGSDKEHILSATVYLADIASFDEFNSVWDSWFRPGTQPVRTCLGASLTGSQYALEITIIAAIKACA